MEQTLESSKRTLPASWVDRIFDRMQGLYGSLWLDRWRTGQIDRATGADIGLLSAKAVWAEELGGFADRGNPKANARGKSAIASAIDACRSQPLPPTLPEFLRMCREAMKRGDGVPQLAYSPSAEEREQQRQAAERVAQTAREKSINASGDALHWATHPGNKLAVKAVFDESQAGNKVMARIFAELVEQGVATSDGKALKVWSNGDWTKA